VIVSRVTAPTAAVSPRLDQFQRRRWVLSSLLSASSSPSAAPVSDGAALIRWDSERRASARVRLWSCRL